MDNLLFIVMQSAHLVAQRKAFQQSMEDVLTLCREQTSSQPLIASALEELKVRTYTLTIYTLSYVLLRCADVLLSHVFSLPLFRHKKATF